MLNTNTGNIGSNPNARSLDGGCFQTGKSSKSKFLSCISLSKINPLVCFKSTQIRSAGDNRAAPDKIRLLSNVSGIIIKKIPDHLKTLKKLKAKLKKTESALIRYYHAFNLHKFSDDSFKRKLSDLKNEVDNTLSEIKSHLQDHDEAIDLNKIYDVLLKKESDETVVTLKEIATELKNKISSALAELENRDDINKNIKANKQARQVLNNDVRAYARTELGILKGDLTNYFIMLEEAKKNLIGSENFSNEFSNEVKRNFSIVNVTLHKLNRTLEKINSSSSLISASDIKEAKHMAKMVLSFFNKNQTIQNLENQTQ